MCEEWVGEEKITRLVIRLDPVSLPIPYTTALPLCVRLLLSYSFASKPQYSANSRLSSSKSAPPKNIPLFWRAHHFTSFQRVFLFRFASLHLKMTFSSLARSEMSRSRMSSPAMLSSHLVCT